MVAQFLAAFGSVFNLCIDSIYKIFVALMIVFLSVIAIACALAFATLWLLT